MGNNQIIQKPLVALQDCCSKRENKGTNCVEKEGDFENGHKEQIISSERSRLYIHTPKRNLDKVLKTLVKKSISEKAGVIDINQQLEIEEAVKPILFVFSQDLAKLKSQSQNIDQYVILLGAYLGELSYIIQNCCKKERIKRVTKNFKQTMSASPASLKFEQTDQLISSQLNRQYHR